MTARFMLGVVFVLVSRWAGAGPPPQPQVAGPETTFTATSANVNDAGRGVKINILRWSNDDDRNALVAAMNPPAQRGNAEPAGERGRSRKCNRLRLHDYRIAARLQRIWRGKGVDQHQSCGRRGRKDDCTGELRSGSCGAEERQAVKDRHYSAELTTPAFGHPSSASASTYLTNQAPMRGNFEIGRILHLKSEI